MFNWAKKYLICVFLLTGSTAFTSFSETAYAQNLVRIGGTGSGLGAVTLLAEAFEKSHPGIKIKVVPSLGSSGGIKALLQGALDMAISARPLKESERKEGAIEMAYAKTPYVFVTHEKVKKSDVTSRELEAIYSGRMLKWPDGSVIRLVLRPEGEADTTIIKSVSPGMDEAVKIALRREGMILAVTDQESAQTIARTSGALGASTLSQIITEKQPLKVLAFNGVRPSVKALANGSYPLSKPLYLVRTAKTKAAALRFVEFVYSPAGGKILAKNGNMVIHK